MIGCHCPDNQSELIREKPKIAEKMKSKEKEDCCEESGDLRMVAGKVWHG